jgi:hypothetical protein
MHSVRTDGRFKITIRQIPENGLYEYIIVDSMTEQFVKKSDIATRDGAIQEMNEALKLVKNKGGIRSPKKFSLI